MSSSGRLVHIVDDVEGLSSGAGDGEGPVLVLSLEGFLDAGSAAGLAARHLAGLAEGPVVATFDVDAFYDYRARRPPVTFARDHYTDYEAPRLVVRLQRDAADTPYLLLTGPEPDNRWEAFARAVREVVERFSVSRVVGMGAVPMAVPHTRPITFTEHANAPARRAGLLTTTSPWDGEMRVPSSAQALLEIRLGEWGQQALGYVAHVPHYLAQLEYPAASVVLLEHVERAAAIAVDLTALREAAAVRAEEVSEYLAEHPEVAEVVLGLERQYDAFRRAEESGEGLLAEDRPLPTADELGNEFEEFLARLDRGDEPPRP
ncbi:proteasome assembly chaperone family protein [Nocardioides sp. CFH 31398]|uniref:proteasome assembly chaperone family protein n=1 Tax=Nocardioides sp. CFH 31398 TaxID=2919579 RepID=UPI001F059039|nr:PAC2 family protein [Nocardioides sp. CFH 31398]MCH1866683.1 PAC2 family protein [Nocardioides sp. CFH 31398]